MLNVRSSRSVFWNIFLKSSGKHLWCSPNISKLFNRPPENRFNDRQCTIHIEQLSDALSLFMRLYFSDQKEFFTISSNLQNFWLHRTTLCSKFCINLNTKQTMVIKGSSAAVSLCKDFFLFHFCYTKQLTDATCQDYSEITQL